MVVDWLYLVLPFFVCVFFSSRGSLTRGCVQGIDWEVSNSKKKGRSIYNIEKTSESSHIDFGVLQNLLFVFSRDWTATLAKGDAWATPLRVSKPTALSFEQLSVSFKKVFYERRCVQNA